MSDYWDDFYGHPILPAGFNSTDVNEDDNNGPGVNWAIVPEWADQFEPLTVLIITEEMLSVFDGCPDFLVPCEDDTHVVSCEDVVAQAGADYPVWMPAPLNNTIVWPWERRGQKIREASP